MFKPRVLLAMVGVSAVALSGCGFPWGPDETVQGSGELSTEIYRVASFDALSVQSDLDVRVEFGDGDQQLVEITIDENLHEQLAIEVTDRALLIRPKPNKRLEPTEQITLYLDGYDVVEFRASSDAHLTAEPPAAQSLVLNASSDAKIDLSVDVDQLSISASSDSEVNVNGRSGDLSIAASSDAVVRVDAEAVNASVDASSDAIIEVVASGRVTGRAQSDGEIKVRGEATIDVQTSSDGRVERVS